MELLFEILLFIVFIALIVIGEIYLGLDKYKTRATVFIKKMTGSLDAWVNCTVELAESSEAGRKSADALHTLAQNYFSCKKYKDTPKKIALVNSIAALSRPFCESIVRRGSRSSSERPLRCGSEHRPAPVRIQ